MRLVHSRREITVPDTVTIPAGNASAGFIVTAVDDWRRDTTGSVPITATAPGYISASEYIQVVDDPAGDHGRDADRATSVLVPSSTKGNIESAGDHDWFQFNASQGVTYTLETELGTLPDSVLRLIGPDGLAQLAMNDDTVAGPASSIQWTAPDSGAYYLDVGGYGNSDLGNYLLHIQAYVDIEL